MDLSRIQALANAHPVLFTLVVRTLLVLFTVLLARLLLRLFRSVIDRTIARLGQARPSRDDGSAERALHLATLLTVVYDVIQALVYGFVLLTALSQFGVSVQPLVAGAGLVGAAVALGSQTIVKDFVSGCFILLEGHFAIGDQITLSPTLSGVVERMTLRVTVLRDADGAVHIVPNGTIAAVTNRSYRWANAVVSLSTPTSADLARVREALERAAKAVSARDEGKETLLADVLVTGPNALKGTSVEWSLAARAQTASVSQVKTWIIEEALRELSAAQIPTV